jgi:1-acyl-sn-glycerol-3-phosphate acyltransferase
VWAPSPNERAIVLAIVEVSGRRVPDPHVPSGPTSPAREVGGRVVDQDGDGIDRWGRAERARAAVRALVETLYRFWFRFSFENVERIPTCGGALLVANHAGVVPVDAALVMHGIERELDRPVYALHHHALAAVPALGVLLARGGRVVAHPDNALRLLRDDRQLLLVFPEGTKGTTKPYRDRYRLARFGRGGFVDTAMRAGVPVVPIAVVGTEETMPIVVRLPGGWPVTLNALLFGPVGAGVHFPATVTARVLEPVVFDEPPGIEPYPSDRVAAAAEMIRARIQAALDEMVPPRTCRRRR